MRGIETDRKSKTIEEQSCAARSTARKQSMF